MLEQTLTLLGFAKGPNGHEFHSGTNYPLRITFVPTDPKKSTIDYGPDIRVHHSSTSNFRQPETIVVLECVLRLLKIGYSPQCIELEKTWKAGHGRSGRLDILLRKKNKAFAMIECKVWGEEYLKERDNMLEDGGQLFSYLIQEKSTQTLILYTSKIESGGIKTQADALDATRLVGTNQQELHASWSRLFVPHGIFAPHAVPYFSSARNLRKADLQRLDRESGRGLFNSFTEVLRRHAISDKSNAFNKIFNLFVCKIYDEDTTVPTDELAFQWKTADTYETLIERLGGLYKRGLKNYLLIDIADQYFSPHYEFAFIDTFNEETREENFSIIKEVVQLLQGYQIKYTSKQQFLGDFFESLLNTGIKQEAGQFFTPIPLARFFLKALPIDTIIRDNIASKSPDVLPYVLDYACGSGHFLTEAIDELQEYIEQIDPAALVGRIQKKFLAVKDNFYWAKDYVYGIEKDYRLAKVAKIAMFLHGDGDAIIITGDGLDDFATSKTFTGLLHARSKTRENPRFDIVVSNPPFSIERFRQYVANGGDGFSLYSSLTAKSREIECLFVERAHQVLKEGGYCGIVLPLSVLNNEIAIYATTRRKLLIDFELNGIVELRDKTFIATNTNTVGMFLRKRRRGEVRAALRVLERYFVGSEEDETVAAALASLEEWGSECAIDAEGIVEYFGSVVDDDAASPEDRLDTSRFPRSLVYALVAYLNRARKTVIAYSGERKEQEDFLGYRFSRRRGKEGIEFAQKEDGTIETALYDSQRQNNAAKVSTHVRANFEGRQLPVDDAVSGNVAYRDTVELIFGETMCIKNPSHFLRSDEFVVESNCVFGDIVDECQQVEVDIRELLKNGDVEYISGLVYEKSRDEVPRRTNRRVLTASNLDLATGRVVLDTKLIHLREDFDLPQKMKPTEGDIIISNASGSLKHLGKVAYVEEKVEGAVIGGFLSILRPKNDRLGKALFYRFLSRRFREYVASLRDQNINNMNREELLKFACTLPRDLEAFFDVVTERERQFRDIEAQVAGLSGRGMEGQ